MKQFKDQNKTNTNSSKRKVILGVGNILLSDDGIGIHVVQAIMKMDIPKGIEVIDGGTSGFGLMNLIIDVEQLIIIDAVKGKEQPGTIYRFTPDDISRSKLTNEKLSVHDIKILDIIDLSTLISQPPDTTIIGIEPKSLEMGMELTQEVQETIPRVIDLVFEKLGITPKKQDMLI